jgi:preprotein translocase subunit YajC
MLKQMDWRRRQGIELAMPSKKQHAELKIGDKVAIPGEELRGTITDVHPHEATVKLESGERRKFALESLHREPTLDEISDYVDH